MNPYEKDEINVPLTLSVFRDKAIRMTDAEKTLTCQRIGVGLDSSDIVGRSRKAIG